MATTKQKYFLVDESKDGDVSEFSTREEVVEFLEQDDDLKERCNDGYNGGNLCAGDTGFRLFKGVEVDIEAESDDLKITLTDR